MIHLENAFDETKWKTGHIRRWRLRTGLQASLRFDTVKDDVGVDPYEIAILDVAGRPIEGIFSRDGVLANLFLLNSFAKLSEIGKIENL